MEEQISEYLKGQGEDIEQDLRDGKPLDSILNDFFLSKHCIDIDYLFSILHENQTRRNLRYLNSMRKNGVSMLGWGAIGLCVSH